jgi:hypothetical protein
MCFREYLTGFSKRKQARHTAVRNKAIEREREEKNEARRAVSFLHMLGCRFGGEGWLGAFGEARAGREGLQRGERRERRAGTAVGAVARPQRVNAG